MLPPENLCVLLVDDDAFVRDGLKIYLQSQNFTTLEADDLASARTTFAAHRPPLAIVDLALPEHAAHDSSRPGAGLQLAREFKTLAPHTGIVLLSAHDHFLDEFTVLLRDGLRGLAYKLKGRRSRQLLDTLYRVLDGQIEIDPGVRPQASSALAAELRQRLTDAERPWVELALQNFKRLTAQEARAAHLLAASHNSEGIAQRLGLQRADTLITRVYDRLGLDAVAQQANEMRSASLLLKACQIHDLQEQSE